MRRGRGRIGQQILTSLAVLIGISVTLVVGFIVAQTDTEVSEVTPATPAAPSATPFTGDTPTPTATSALLEAESSRATASPQAEQPTTMPPSATEETEACGPPPGWTTYTVRPGDNLFRIGLRYGQNVDSMLQANCLTSEQVAAGQTLYVPPVTPLPPTATQTPPASDTPEPDQSPTLVPGCDDPGAQITSPVAGTTVTKDVFFTGTAEADDFNFYKLEIRSADGEEYTTFDGAEAPAFNELLGRVGAYAFTPGQYVVRLAVVDTTSTIVAECSIPLTLEGGPTATPLGES